MSMPFHPLRQTPVFRKLVSKLTSPKECLKGQDREEQEGMEATSYTTKVPRAATTLTMALATVH